MTNTPRRDWWAPPPDDLSHALAFRGMPPADKEAIKEVTDRIEEAGNSDPESTLVVYTVSSVGAGYLYPLIQRAVPKATYTVGSDPSQLLVWARPEEHLHDAYAARAKVYPTRVSQKRGGAGLARWEVTRTATEALLQGIAVIDCEALLGAA